MLRERLDSGAEMHAFADVDAIEALDCIVRERPRIVALEQDFSATLRGTALIRRIKADPSLSDTEVRVVARDGASLRPMARHLPFVYGDPSTLDQKGTRRAPRVRMGEGSAALIDGIQIVLVDLSVIGAQVVSKTVLKPNQRVRLALSDARGVIRCQGAIAWASFEMPKDGPKVYRAGIEFKSADAEALSGYSERHRQRAR